jgi:hypothetical protein
MLLGIAIALSPWLTRQANYGLGSVDYGPIVLNALLVGVIFFGLAQLEYVALQRWEEIAAFALGLWLILSPHLLGYAGDGALRFWHWGLGAMAIALAALELWQDRNLSDRELAKHGE